MSRDAQPPGRPTSAGGARPDDARFLEEVDTRAGSIRAQGELTPRAADMLGDTVDVLHRLGHSRIVMDLHGVDPVDEAGERAIRSLQSRVTAAGGTVNLPRPRASES